MILINNQSSSNLIVEVRQRIGDSLSSDVANRLGHPYYWAPFILIGNGL